MLVGMLVMLPSQMSIVDDFSRRWTDMLWSGSRRVREIDVRQPGAADLLHDSQLVRAVVAGLAYLFSTYGTPKLMTIVIANLNNLAIGVTAFHLLWINCRLLPASCARVVSAGWGRRLRRFLSRAGAAGLRDKQLPELRKLLESFNV